MLVVAIGTMALIIVLSVFNGLEGLLRNLYGTIDPNLIVSPAKGKTFEFTPEMSQQVADIPGVINLTDVLEDNVLIKYNTAQRVARVKGVSESFLQQGRLDAYMAYGDLVLQTGRVPYAIVGRGVQYDLSINPSNDFYSMQMYYPQNIRPGVTNPERMFNIRNILPGGVFAVEKSYDENYVFVPIEFAEDLFNKPGKRSSLELQVDQSASLDQIQADLRSLLGPDFIIQSSEEIHGGLYKILKMEKFFVFLTFSLIIAIASINIFFALTMLAIDKKKDIAILTSQGASDQMIRSIFLMVGCIVAFTGAGIGLILGLGVSFVQEQFGLVSMGMQTAIMDAYPVKVEWLDVLYTLLCIITITVITSIQPAYRAAATLDVKNLKS